MKKILKWVLLGGLFGGLLGFGLSLPAKAEPLTKPEAAVMLQQSVVELRRGVSTNPFCTGTKIGPGRYLTALHCVRDLPTNLKVRMEGHGLNNVTGIFAPTLSKNFPKNKRSREDWAILFTEKVNEDIPSVPLSCGEEIYLGQDVAYLGYGVPLNPGFFSGYVVSINPANNSLSNFDFAVSQLVSGGASGSALISLDTGSIIGVVTEFAPGDRTITHATGIQQTSNFAFCDLD